MNLSYNLAKKIFKQPVEIVAAFHHGTLIYITLGGSFLPVIMLIELLWLVLFIFALILARARGEVRRLFGGMVYGTITEFTVYMGLEAAKIPRCRKAI